MKQELTKDQKEWRTVWITITSIGLAFLAIAAWQTYHVYKILGEVKQLKSEQIEELVIAPKDSNYPCDFAHTTVRVKDQKTITKIIQPFRDVEERYRGKQVGNGCSAYVTVKLKSKKEIILEIVSSQVGCFIIINAKGTHPAFFCNPLKQILDEATHSKGIK